MYLLVILINLMHHCLTKVLFSLEKNFTDPDFWTVVHDQIFKNYGKLHSPPTMFFVHSEAETAAGNLVNFSCICEDT